MNEWYLRAPWWQLVLVNGVPAGVLYLLGRRLMGASWSEAAASALLFGIVFGLGIGTVTAVRNRRRRAEAGDPPRRDAGEGPGEAAS